MKKIFGQNRETNENTDNFTQFDGEYYEESGYDGGYYADGEEIEGAEDGAYYADAEEIEGAEDGVYYADAEEMEGAEDGVYYADAEEMEGAEDGVYYADAADGGASDGEVYDESAEYYEEADSGYYEDDVEFYEDEEYEDEEDSRQGFFARFANLAAMDYVMLCTGVGILLLAVITGIVWVNSQKSAGQFSEFATVGTQLEGIEIIGDDGLLAVADARIAKMEAIKLQEENNKEYNETEYNKSVNVLLKTVSVQKDLKIKFVNQGSGKLIPNTPFTVTVATPDNKTETWEDDDMDGIIYKKGITPGAYQVSVNALSGEKYKGYTLPSGTLKADVKKDIEYKKVDVSDEVKTESQVNVDTEEQKKQEPQVESSLTDTVEWVESTEIASTYIEVSRKNIPDPRLFVKNGSFLRTAKGVKLDHSSAEMKVGGESLKLKPSYSLDNVVSVGWSSSDTSVADVDADGVVTAVSEGTATISCIVTVSVETENGVKETEYEAVCEVTVLGKNGENGGEEKPSASSGNGSISLNKKTLTVYVDATATLEAKLKNADEDSVTAESSDEDVATVENDGTTITVTGVEAGTAKITVSAETDDGMVSAVCAVTVKESPEYDEDSPLKDDNGNQLYVQEGDSYRQAVAADYYKEGMTFFRKGETKYTGWQTIDGKVYFFDKTGKKVTGEQVIQGARYTFASDGSLVTGSGTMGIDVSKHNGSIDWNAVKNSGVSYVIIRCGYRGYTQGSLIIDSKFEQNIRGATAAGLKVGVYFFSQAVDEVEAVEEASFVLDVVKNYKISYPIFLDVEYSGAAGNKGRADGLSKSARTAVCKAFCATIKSGGYTAGIYANKSWLETMIDPGQLGSYKIWLAQYAASPTYAGRYDLWQYKSTGRVSGISGNVDMNLSYLGY